MGHFPAEEGRQAVGDGQQGLGKRIVLPLLHRRDEGGRLLLGQIQTAGSGGGRRIGQSIGRWGNFFNSEAHGGPTDLPWAVIVNGQGVHPTFLYESLWCLLLCVFLMLMSRNIKFSGQIFCMYAVLYSVERFFVEGLRTDSLMIGPFRQAQVLSLSLIVIFAVIYILLDRRSKRI